MKHKQPKIKLGEIKDGKLVKFTDSIVWDFNKTLAIFIRDGLKRFRQVGNGVPNSVVNKYKTIEDAAEAWDSILENIITLINFHLEEDTDILSSTDREKLFTYHKTERKVLSREENSDGTIKVTFEEMPEDIKDIYKQLQFINKQQHKAMQEALDLIKEYWGEFWW